MLVMLVKVEWAFWFCKIDPYAIVELRGIIVPIQHLSSFLITQERTLSGRIRFSCWAPCKAYHSHEKNEEQEKARVRKCWRRRARQMERKNAKVWGAALHETWLSQFEHQRNTNEAPIKHQLGLIVVN